MFLTSRMRKRGYNASSGDYHSPIRIGLILMSPRPWKIPLGRLSVVIINPRIGRRLLGIGRERINLDFIGRDLNHPNNTTKLLWWIWKVLFPRNMFLF
jgi:hypothetical protein